MNSQDWWRAQHAERLIRLVAIIVLELIVLAGVLMALYWPEREYIDDAEPAVTYEPIVITPLVVADSAEAEPVTTTYYDIGLDDAVQDELFTLCENYSLPVSLVLAIIEVESGFDEDAVSYTDDYGLMQINSCNFAWLGEDLDITDFLDPIANIRAGCYILYTCMMYADGDIEKALMAYNMGTGAAMVLWEDGVTSTTYTQKVLEAMTNYE